MATLNLLPWRDAYREKKRNRFVQVLVVVCLLSAVEARVQASQAAVRGPAENGDGARALAQAADAVRANGAGRRGLVRPARG